MQTTPIELYHNVKQLFKLGGCLQEKCELDSDCLKALWWPLASYTFAVVISSVQGLDNLCSCQLPQPRHSMSLEQRMDFVVNLDFAEHGLWWNITNTVCKKSLASSDGVPEEHQVASSLDFCC